MTGLYLLILAAVWLVLASVLAYVITRQMKSGALRLTFAVLLMSVLMPLPLIDEIVGQRQFEQLCKDNATIHVDRATAVGKTVYFVPQPAVEIKGTWVRVVMKPKRFVDATTGETVVNYNELMADGGRFIRTLGIFEGGVPLTFSGTCVPANRPGSIQTFEPFGINYIEPPISNKRN
jgi:hypothetical protein